MQCSTLQGHQEGFWAVSVQKSPTCSACMEVWNKPGILYYYKIPVQSFLLCEYLVQCAQCNVLCKYVAICSVLTMTIVYREICSDHLNSPGLMRENMERAPRQLPGRLHFQKAAARKETFFGTHFTMHQRKRFIGDPLYDANVPEKHWLVISCSDALRVPKGMFWVRKHGKDFHQRKGGSTSV